MSASKTNDPWICNSNRNMRLPWVTDFQKGFERYLSFLNNIDKLFVNETKTHLIQYTYPSKISEKNPGGLCHFFHKDRFKLTLKLH